MTKRLEDQRIEVENGLRKGWNWQNLKYQSCSRFLGQETLWFTGTLPWTDWGEVAGYVDLEIKVDNDFYAYTRERGSEVWQPLDDLYIECNE